MYCNLALFQWTLFSLHPGEEAGLALGPPGLELRTISACFGTRIGQGETQIWGFLIGSAAGAGQRGGGSPFPWPNQDNLDEDLAAGGWTGGIPVPRRIPPGARLGTGSLSWGGTEARLKSSRSNPRTVTLKGRRVKLRAASLRPKASFPSVNRVQSVTCHVLY